MAARSLRFSSFTLDLDRLCLIGPAGKAELRPKSFEVLRYLLEHSGRVIGKEELIKAVWPDVTVTDESLTRCISEVRRAISDENQRVIKTVPRRGYLLDASTSPDGATTGPADTESTTEPGSLSPPRLSIVVLPFGNLSGDLEQDYFADGVTESLTTDLSRISGLFVIGRHTAFTYKGEANDLKKIGRELNVRYALEGSVQRSVNRLRVNVRLVDAETANHLWAERFDKPIADLFDMQDEIVSRLAQALRAQLVVAEARRAERSLHPDAMDLIFQGWAYLSKGTAPDHMTRARGFFERALELDHQSIDALLGMAVVDVMVGGAHLTDDRTARFLAAETNAIKALSLAPAEAVAHLVLGNVYIFTNRTSLGIAEFEHPLLLDRNLANANSGIGLAKFFMGQAAETERHVLEAFRLSPRGIFAHLWMHYVGMAKIQIGADAEAADWLRRSIEDNRNFPPAHFWLAAALGLLGALEEARTAANAGLALNPSFTIRRFRAVKPSDNPTFLAGLERACIGMRLAGVPGG